MKLLKQYVYGFSRKNSYTHLYIPECVCTHMCVCVCVCIVLLIVIYLNFNKELNNLINDDFETSGKITKYVIICIYKLFIIYNYNL